MRILIAGFQHETNTFAPSLADWAAFTRGDSFPAFARGAAMQAQMTGINIPVGGFIDAAKSHGWTLLPSCWAGAIPSSYVTRDAFERIAGAITEDVRAALAGGGLDGPAAGAPPAGGGWAAGRGPDAAGARRHRRGGFG